MIMQNDVDSVSEPAKEEIKESDRMIDQICKKLLID